MANLDDMMHGSKAAKDGVAAKARRADRAETGTARRIAEMHPTPPASRSTRKASAAKAEMAGVAPLICNHVMIRMATRQLGLLFDGVVTSTNLKATQCGMLMQIEALRTPTMKDLAKTLVMDLSALGHTLKPLVRDGYVELVPDPDDRRSKRVDLTPAGSAKLIAIKQLWREATIRFETALGIEKARDLRAMLAVVASDEFGHAFREAKPRKI